MIANAKIETVFTGFFSKRGIVFLTKASLNTILLLWINKRQYKTKRESEEKGDKSETELKPWSKRSKDYGK